MTMGIFSIVTTEILPIGLLTSVGSSFRISDGTAGTMMIMPGTVAAIVHWSPWPPADSTDG
ncbi:hypothetical protein ACTXG6_42635 [Pseudonocardia sp. Cha107L01]|uniref:hypothetical protein n=1 Tax=Pseudonocardia sp. Cha107L01 TaxID=3457576 RepID=UPI00403E8E83